MTCCSESASDVDVRGVSGDKRGRCGALSVKGRGLARGVRLKRFRVR